jgi:hypothetical protein
MSGRVFGPKRGEVNDGENSEPHNSKFCDTGIWNISLNVSSKEGKFIQIYLVILKTLIIHNLKEKSVL